MLRVLARVEWCVLARERLGRQSAEGLVYLGLGWLDGVGSVKGVHDVRMIVLGGLHRCENGEMERRAQDRTG